MEQIIGKDPKRRLSAAEFMSKYRGTILVGQLLSPSLVRTVPPTLNLNFSSLS